MPWLLLEMGLDRDIEEVQLSRDEYMIKPSGITKMKLVAMDTDKGKITEVEYTIQNGVLKERAPNYNEVKAANQALGKDKSPPPDRNRNKLEAQLRNAKAQLTESERDRVSLRRERDRLTAENSRMRHDRESIAMSSNKTPSKSSTSLDGLFTEDAKSVLEAALFSYIGELRQNVQLETYSDAKELYHLLTGEEYEPFTESDIEEGE